MDREDVVGASAWHLDGHALRKQHFRDRMLDAAEELILEKGDASFSTRDLAKRAGVSQATPFNHFGSKMGVLDALIERSLAEIAFATRVTSEDPLDRMFEAVDPVIRYYSRRVSLYRPVFAVVLGHDSAGPALVRAISHWRKSLLFAQRSGLIQEGRDLDAIAEQLEANWLGTALSWIQYSLSHEQWRDVARYNLALTLCGVVTDNARARAMKEVRRLEESMGRRRPR